MKLNPQISIARHLLPSDNPMKTGVPILGPDLKFCYIVIYLGAELHKSIYEQKIAACTRRSQNCDAAAEHVFTQVTTYDAVEASY